MNPPSWWRRYDRTPVVELGRSKPTRIGIVVLVILVIGVYFGFTKHIPFKHGFRLKAVFATAVNIRPLVAGAHRRRRRRQGQQRFPSGPYRAGHDGNRIERPADPRRRDGEDPPPDLPGRQLVRRTAARQPSAKTLSSGATLPITQTSDPVQLDQVLDALNTDTRANLQDFLIGYGDGLTRKPNAAENAEQDPEVRGLNAAQALNKAYQRGPASLRGAAVLNQAISGTVPARPLEAGGEHRQSDRGAERPRAAAR